MPKTDDERRLILDACDQIRLVQNLPEDLQQQIAQIRESSFGSSYFERLRRWVGKRLHSDYDSVGATGFSAADKRASELAEEGFTKGISETEIKWLTSPEAENVWSFGYRLGELDKKGMFFDQILFSTPDNLNSLFLSSYLQGERLTAGPERGENMLDRVAQEKPEAAFGATWRGPATMANAERIIRLVSSGRVDGSMLRILLYGAWVGNLPPEGIVKMVDLMLHHQPKNNLESVLGIIDQSVRSGAIAVQEFSELVWHALEIEPQMPSPNFDWRWAQVANLVAVENPSRLARIFVRFFESDETWLSTDSAQGVLRTATVSNPAAVWEVIGPALLRGDSTSLRLRLKLDHWFGDLLPAELLLDWARDHGSRAFLISASLLNAKTIPLSHTAKLLVKYAPKPGDVMGVLTGGMKSGGFWGPMSARLEQDIAILEKWANDDEPTIREWAQIELRSTKKSIQQHKLFEEEQRD